MNESLIPPFKQLFFFLLEYLIYLLFLLRIHCVESQFPQCSTVKGNYYSTKDVVGMPNVVRIKTLILEVNFESLIFLPLQNQKGEKIPH